MISEQLVPCVVSLRLQHVLLPSFFALSRNGRVSVQQVIQKITKLQKRATWQVLVAAGGVNLLQLVQEHVILWRSDVEDECRGRVEVEQGPLRGPVNHVALSQDARNLRESLVVLIQPGACHTKHATTDFHDKGCRVSHQSARKNADCSAFQQVPLLEQVLLLSQNGYGQHFLLPSS